MGIGSFIGGLFGGGKSAETVASTIQDTAKSGMSIIDNAFFTDQEKSAASAKLMDTYAQLMLSTTQESSGTAEARRWFLQRITHFVFFVALVVMGLQVAAVFTGNIQYVEAAKVISQTVKDFWIGEAFAGAVSFYYLTHVAKAIKGQFYV